MEEVKKPIITVIVPVYNTQQWLGQCIQSIQNQTLREIEILLVDDGSTDFSGVLCDAYADYDRRISVIHQDNKGVSAARNTGLRCAQGEYVMFCDSDDFVEPEWCDCLLRLAKAHPDAWICSGVTYADNEGRTWFMQIYDEAHPISRIIYGTYLNFLKTCQWCSVWNQIFERRTLRQNNISFCEGMNYGEDDLFVLSYWKRKNYGIVCNQKPLYNYRRLQRDSLSTKFLGLSRFNKLRQEFHLLRFFISQEEIDRFLNWQFWQLGPNCIRAVLEPRNPDLLEKQMKDCQSIVESPEFRECCLAAVPENTTDPVLFALRKGDFRAAYPGFVLWMEEQQKKREAEREASG